MFLAPTLLRVRVYESSQMGSFLVGLDSCSCVRRAEHGRREEAKKLGPVGDLIVLMGTTIDGSVCRRPYVALRFRVGFPYVHFPFFFGRRDDDDERCNSSLLCRCNWSWLNLCNGFMVFFSAQAAEARERQGQQS